MNDHDASRPCRLSPEDEPACGEAAVVAVEDAASALSAIEGARIAQVADWSAARRLLALPWNHRIDGLAR